METQHPNHQHWALNVYGWDGNEPSLEVNQYMSISGPLTYWVGDTIWSSETDLHYFQGLNFERTLQNLAPGNSDIETSNLNGNGLLVTRKSDQYGFLFRDTSKIQPGVVYVSGADVYEPTRVKAVQLDKDGLSYTVSDNGTEESQTVIDGDGITAPIVHATSFVSTPKWKVVPDYVFEKGYKLKSLEETERFVREKKHLPGIPSAKEMSSKGMDLTEMNLKLLKNMEEMTLHMIALDRKLNEQQEKNLLLEREVKALRGAGKGN